MVATRRTGTLDALGKLVGASPAEAGLRAMNAAPLLCVAILFGRQSKDVCDG